MIARRGFLGALVGLVAAPAIIRVADLMPVKPSLMMPRPNLYLTLDEITRGTARLFVRSNTFLQSLQTTALDIELGIMPRMDEALPPNFFGGVREEGSVASPGFSSSVHPRRINQETVA